LGGGGEKEGGKKKRSCNHSFVDLKLLNFSKNVKKGREKKLGTIHFIHATLSILISGKGKKKGKKNRE